VRTEASACCDARVTAATFPPPEDRGGWPVLASTAEIESEAGLTAWKLDLAIGLAGEWSGPHSFGVVIVRRGVLVAESYSRNVGSRTRFDLWSCTKSFTSLAWGMLLADQDARTPSGERVTLDTPAYPLIPDAHPLSDPRKEQITIGHLLSMTSGIKGESIGAGGMPTLTGSGIFEYGFGHAPNRYGQWVDRLAHDPGAGWDYSDPGYTHLAWAFAAVAGCELRDYLEERLLSRIGVEASWELQGGSGFLGPRTNAHTGLHMSGRDLARVGHLLLRGGEWEDAQLVPREWIEKATTTSQPFWPMYGYGFWTNASGEWLDGVPRDTIILAGYGGNRCYVVPSQDLVVVRVGNGPEVGAEATLLVDVLGAIR
jgi:CubicO group peptidase (beta-lactamase class C family)